MPLTLLTGPANSEKARHVLDAYRAAAPRGAVLVVPTFEDVGRYRRELAEAGMVFEAHVVRFDWLWREIARRTGTRARPLGPLARERVAARAAARLRLEALGDAAATPGFPAAACRLFDELEEQRVAPRRLTAALRAWAGGDPARRRYGDEVAALYGAYRAALERLGRTDATLARAASLDALREDPACWGGRPVLLYGFDDLTLLQRDAVLSLAATGAEVTVSLTFEPGRHAFAGRAVTVADLEPAADRRGLLEAGPEHYAPCGRAALHHLERRIFEAEAAPAGDGPATLFHDVAARADGHVAAGDTVRFLEGGGERAELELVAAEVARLVREEGYAPEEIAVVVRDLQEASALVEQVFAASEVPVALERRAPLGHTPLGRGLVALLRAGACGGTADDVVRWLRTPGLVRVPGRVDRLEAEVRRAGAVTAAEARALWEAADGWPLDALDRVATAGREGALALLDRLEDELTLLFEAPRRRQAAVLDAAEAADAGVLAAGRRALRDLRELAVLDAQLAPGAAEVAEVLARVDVFVSDRGRPGGVRVTEPLRLRARRVRALFACRLQAGAFPRPPRPEPFLGDAERAQVNVASGLRLRLREDVLPPERFLFYATVSRPEERLYLSWHTATDEGEPVVRSAFVDDAALVFGDAPLDRCERRDLGAVGWPGGRAPVARDELRAQAAAAPRCAEPVAGPLSDPGPLRALRSASALEAWASCPVKCLVERVLRPEGLDPDPEPLKRGLLAHAVLRDVFSAQPELVPATLPEAVRLLGEALERRSPEHPLSPDPARQATLIRRLRSDLERYLAWAAEAQTGFRPTWFEQGFDVDLGDGLQVRGTIDRIDVDAAGRAVVYDYKGKTAEGREKWLDNRRFQPALYALAVRSGAFADPAEPGRRLEPVAALYQPLGARDMRPRGLVRDDAGLPAAGRDAAGPQGFDAVLLAVAEAARGARRELEAGAIAPRPESCAWDGSGCAYPTICRCEAGS